MFGRCHISRLIIAALLLSYVGAGLALAQTTIPDFSFAQTSDDHNQPKSGITIAEFRNPQPIVLQPYKITAPAVSFVIGTGDETEFGPINGTYATYVNFYSGVKIPRYITLGNHDATWRSLANEIRAMYGSLYYSFDKYGCHFVVLDSAGVQDPRPNIGPEQLIWLKNDLERVGREVPVFVAFHHPPDSTEFSSRYEVDRLLDILRPYNIVVLLVGHGHSAVHSVYQGFDVLEGGSTYGPCPAGYQVVSVVGGIVRAVYKHQGEAEATKPMFEKPIAAAAKRYPAITIAAPKAGGTYRGELPIKSWIALGKGELKDASAEIDGEAKTDLALEPGGSIEGSASLGSLTPGAHYMKLTFHGQAGAAYTRSTFFYVDSAKPRVLWRVFMGTASKTTPTLSDGAVYVGGYDGAVRAYSAKSGALRWQYQTGGGVNGQILLLGDKIYAVSEDKRLYCLTAAKGALVWKFEAEDPIYSSPVSDGKSIYFGCGTGAFYAIDIATGKQIWKNSDAVYNVESKPFLANGKVYYGAWDRYVYCVNTADGRLVWKCEGKGSSEGGAAIYYSPADCGPVLCEGKVFAPDRKYRCAIIDDVTGKIVSSLNSVSAVSVAADGKSLYLRLLDRQIQKVDTGGNVIWTAEVPADDVPTTPTEVNGVVYVCGRRGMASALSAADGKILWQYQTTPSSYVLAGVAASTSAAYIVGTDGSLTALGH